MCNKSNTTSATRGVGTAYPSVAPEFTLGISGVRVAPSLVFCVMFCRSLFVYFDLFLLRILITPLVFSVTDSDYPFGIFFLQVCMNDIYIQKYHRSQMDHFNQNESGRGLLTYIIQER